MKASGTAKPDAPLDDIYGRLSFAGSTGFLAAYGADQQDTRISELENSMESDEKGNILSPWIHAILFFRTDESMSPVLEASVPRGRVIKSTGAACFFSEH